MSLDSSTLCVLNILFDTFFFSDSLTAFPSPLWFPALTLPPFPSLSALCFSLSVVFCLSGSGPSHPLTHQQLVTYLLLSFSSLSRKDGFLLSTLCFSPSGAEIARADARVVRGVRVWQRAQTALKCVAQTLSYSLFIKPFLRVLRTGIMQELLRGLIPYMFTDMQNHSPAQRGTPESLAKTILLPNIGLSRGIFNQTLSCQWWLDVCLSA